MKLGEKEMAALRPQTDRSCTLSVFQKRPFKMAWRALLTSRLMTCSSR